MKKHKRNSGITLVALVISVIVMLILAGVSLNATIGENGIITKAQEAKLMQEDVERREQLELILYKYNSSEFLNEGDGFANFLNRKKEDGTIEEYFALNGKVIVKYKGKYYELNKEGIYYSLGDNFELNVGNGKHYLISKDNADEQGSLQFEVGSTYTIVDEINAEKFNFVIPSAEGDPNKAVNINLLADITIDNKDYNDRSAIELLDGAILNLYIGEGVTATVNSGFGESGETAESLGAKGGPRRKSGNTCARNSNVKFIWRRNFDSNWW